MTADIKPVEETPPPLGLLGLADHFADQPEVGEIDVDQKPPEAEVESEGGES